MKKGRVVDWSPSVFFRNRTRWLIGFESKKSSPKQGIDSDRSVKPQETSFLVFFLWWHAQKLWFSARSTSEVGRGQVCAKAACFECCGGVFSMFCFVKRNKRRQTLLEIACSLLAPEVQWQLEQGLTICLLNLFPKPCREQTGNPSHKLRRYLGSLFKSMQHYASAGQESLAWIHLFH